MSVKSRRSNWSKQEQDQFWELYLQYKKDFQRYVPHIPGRDKRQVKSYYYNYLRVKEP